MSRSHEKRVMALVFGLPPEVDPGLDRSLQLDLGDDLVPGQRPVREPDAPPVDFRFDLGELSVPDVCQPGGRVSDAGIHSDIGDLAGLWTVVDRGLNREPNTPRYGVCPADHIPAQEYVVTSRQRGVTRRRPTGHQVELSGGLGETYEEAQVRAAQMNEIEGDLTS